MRRSRWRYSSEAMAAWGEVLLSLLVSRSDRVARYLERSLRESSHGFFFFLLFALPSSTRKGAESDLGRRSLSRYLSSLLFFSFRTFTKYPVLSEKPSLIDLSGVSLGRGEPTELLSL